jgi:hypothetical protein
MTPQLRKFALTAHVTFSVGWLGAVAAFLVLAVAGLISHDAQTVRAVYFALPLIGWFVIVPSGLASLVTGLVQSLGTEWGLFRHYWVLVKFLLTIGAVALLLVHMQPVERISGAVAATTLSSADFRPLRLQLIADAGLALLVLLAATTLSVYKPWGLTPYAQRTFRRRSNSDTPWGRYVLLGILAVVILVALVHLAGGGLGGHGQH